MADPDDEDDEGMNEVVGSCNGCGADVYGFEDDGSGFCDQCQWYTSGGSDQ